MNTDPLLIMTIIAGCCFIAAIVISFRGRK